MRGRRRQTDHVQNRAAADRDDVGVAVDVIAVDVRMNFRDVKVGILRALAAFDDKRRTDQLQGFGEGGEVRFDVAAQLGLRPGQGFIENDERLVLRFLLAAGQRVAQHRI